MGNFFVILAITLIVVLLAVFIMSIGWILTGKVRIVRGACGMDPQKLRDKQCGTPDFHCDLCDSKKKSKDED